PMRFEPQHALFSHHFGLAAQAIDQGAKGARSDLVWQSRAQRLHLEAGGNRLGAMMGGERFGREALELLPFDPGREAFLVAERELDEARILERRLDFPD